MSEARIGERVMALETWITGHEKQCAERYGSLRADLKWILRGIIGLLLAVCAWLAIQLWSESEARLVALEHLDEGRRSQAGSLLQAAPRPRAEERARQLQNAA